MFFRKRLKLVAASELSLSGLVLVIHNILGFCWWLSLDVGIVKPLHGALTSERTLRGQGENGKPVRVRHCPRSGMQVTNVECPLALDKAGKVGGRSEPVSPKTCREDITCAFEGKAMVARLRPAYGVSPQVGGSLYAFVPFRRPWRPHDGHVRRTARPFLRA